mmetsp:Transcript_14384/g.24532  ORF Transcript_14384/g.24532 Transcript_14384/m.24532 type:complete len:304 (-) Transcript_14384:17-928(-)
MNTTAAEQRTTTATRRARGGLRAPAWPKRRPRLLVRQVLSCARANASVARSSARSLAAVGQARGANARQRGHRERGHEVGRAVPRVREGVAGERRLRHDPGEGEHREAAVGKLLLLHHFNVLLVGEAERVELVVAAGRGVGVVHDLEDLGHAGGQLDDREHQEQEEHRALLHRRVVRVQRRHLWRVGHAETQVDRDPAGDRKHAHARVLQLRLARPLERHQVRDLERVEAEVASHRAVKLRRHLQEGDGLLGLPDALLHGDGAALNRGRAQSGGHHRAGEGRSGSEHRQGHFLRGVEVKKIKG